MHDNFICLDCKESTWDEYYMIHNEIWLQTGLNLNDGMLCIGCVEKRLGRKLSKKDFTCAPINSLDMFEKTERLKNRLLS